MVSVVSGGGLFLKMNGEGGVYKKKKYKSIDFDTILN